MNIGVFAPPARGDTFSGTLASPSPQSDSAARARSDAQDDAVAISPQGYDAAARDEDAAGRDDPASSQPTAAQPDPNAQPVQSLVYGALGLERPDQPPDPNRAYSIGRWLAAGITVGGLVSLFV